MDLPGYGLHALTVDLKGFWSVSVSRNWRIVDGLGSVSRTASR